MWFEMLIFISAYIYVCLVLVMWSVSESSERFLYKIHITLSISANCYVFEWLVRHLFDICRFLSRKYSLVKSDTDHKCHLLSPPVSESFVEDSRVISVTCSFTWQCKEILANFFRSPLNRYSSRYGTCLQLGCQEKEQRQPPQICWAALEEEA